MRPTWLIFVLLYLHARAHRNVGAVRWPFLPCVLTKVTCKYNPPVPSKQFPVDRKIKNALLVAFVSNHLSINRALRPPGSSERFAEGFLDDDDDDETADDDDLGGLLAPLPPCVCLAHCAWISAMLQRLALSKASRPQTLARWGRRSFPPCDWLVPVTPSECDRPGSGSESQGTLSDPAANRA